MWGFAWDQKQLRWPASGPLASVCHSAEVTLVVMWRVDALSSEHIKDDRRAGLRQWELQSLLSTTFFLSGLTPTPLGPPFLTFFTVCLPGWGSRPQHLLEVTVNSNDSATGHPAEGEVCLHARLWVLETRMFKMSLRQGWGFSGGASGKESTCQCKRYKRCGFDPWVRKIPWRRATHSRIPAWRIPWTEEPGGLQSGGLQRGRHDWSDRVGTQDGAPTAGHQACLHLGGEGGSPRHRPLPPYPASPLQTVPAQQTQPNGGDMNLEHQESVTQWLSSSSLPSLYPFITNPSAPDAFSLQRRGEAVLSVIPTSS